MAPAVCDVALEPLLYNRPELDQSNPVIDDVDDDFGSFWYFHIAERAGRKHMTLVPGVPRDLTLLIM